MAAVVHGGNLGRWFEELCRFKVRKLAEIVRVRHATGGGPARALSAVSSPHKGGIYAFWWTGDCGRLADRCCTLTAAGPGGREVIIQIDDEWLGLSTGLPVPLYVGKTADSIRKRVGLHLMLGTPGRALGQIKPGRKAPAPTTSCQLRAGVERLFPTEPNPVDLILEHVGLSYVVLDGDDHAANRFYLEDLAVGLLRPPLNVDIER
jgi:hypothetical protein